MAGRKNDAPAASHGTLGVITALITAVTGLIAALKGAGCFKESREAAHCVPAIGACEDSDVCCSRSCIVRGDETVGFCAPPRRE